LKNATWTAEARAKAVDFALFDTYGRVARLSDFRGKPILLSFWARREADCLKQVPQWIAFQRRHPEITILAVSLDALPDEHHHSHEMAPATARGEMHDHEAMHHHEEMMAMDDDSADANRDVAIQLRDFAKGNHLNYRVLIDRNGQTSLAYAADDPPICVWVDKDGNVRRRMRLPEGDVAAALEAVARSMTGAERQVPIDHGARDITPGSVSMAH
jgi:peroxiredoxin